MFSARLNLRTQNISPHRNINIYFQQCATLCLLCCVPLCCCIFTVTGPSCVCVLCLLIITSSRHHYSPPPRRDTYSSSHHITHTHPSTTQFLLTHYVCLPCRCRLNNWFRLGNLFDTSLDGRPVFSSHNSYHHNHHIYSTMSARNNDDVLPTTFRQIEHELVIVGFSVHRLLDNSL